MFLGVFGLVFWAFALLVAAMASAATAYIRNLETCMMLRYIRFVGVGWVQLTLRWSVRR